MPKNTSDSAPMADDSRASRNSRTSSEGYRTLASYQTKKASIARPPSAGPSTSRCTQEPLSPPWMMPYTRSTRPAMEASTPTKSIRPGLGFFDSGTSRAIATTLAAQNGTLIRNTEPHQKWASSRPPTMGPMAMPMPTATAQIPMARGRSAGSNTLEMIDSVCGITAAAARPIAARAQTSWSGCVSRR